MDLKVFKTSEEIQGVRVCLPNGYEVSLNTHCHHLCVYRNDGAQMISEVCADFNTLVDMVDRYKRCEEYIPCST